MRPAPDSLPGRFETSTQNHEGLAGVLGAVEYFDWLGQTFGQAYEEKYAGRFSGCRLHLKQALAAVRAYEFEINRAVLAALGDVPGLRLYGLVDPRRLEARVPTLAFTLEGWHPRQVAEKMAAQNINMWEGNYYAISVTERLGLEESGGMVRVGPVYYNTLEEVGRLKEALRGLV